ncbi:MAG TPA: hypothetical protein VGD62_10020 [Acidobacteriaceae bacterium]
MGAYSQMPVFVPQKSMLLSLVLTFFFGPLGMFYSTILGGLVMLVAYVVIGILTLGWGLAVLHPVAMAWGAWAVHEYNGRAARRAVY